VAVDRFLLAITSPNAVVVLKRGDGRETGLEWAVAREGPIMRQVSKRGRGLAIPLRPAAGKDPTLDEENMQTGDLGQDPKRETSSPS